MAANSTDPETAPGDLVNVMFDAVEAGKHEVLADEVSMQLKEGLSALLEAVYTQLGRMSE
ncbi:hypothetical protein ACIPVK_01700 [Paeniglutamicibacter sp. MACA_103]|uniref:hypothetical protein n=1 Tax=Paeniglutamicibacter sp. MACA_103 TaxID=3377337 RepID=UPI0038944AEA